MVDKGYTRAAYIKMRSLMPEEFQIQDLPHGNSGMLRRGIEYGIVTRVRNGWYKVAEGVKDPWKAYSDIATKIKARGNPIGRDGIKINKRALVLANPSHPPPLDIGPRVSIAAYGQQQLIVIGKQIFLGVEVALIPKGRQHG
jgi:hypothetical protein